MFPYGLLSRLLVLPFLIVGNRCFVNIEAGRVFRDAVKVGDGGEYANG